MSSGKKKKAIKTPVDKMYDEVCSMHKQNFNVKLKSEHFIPLMKQLREGNVAAGFALAILDAPGVPAHARVPDIFPLTEMPRKTYLVSGIIEGSSRSLLSRTIALMPAVGDINKVFILNINDNDIMSVSRQAMAFITIHSENELPFDMRKWDAQLASMYFRSMYSNNRVSRVTDQWRRKEILSEDTRRKEILVHIRKVNPNPSRKQRKRIDVEKIEHLKRQQAASAEASDSQFPWLKSAPTPIDMESALASPPSDEPVTMYTNYGNNHYSPQSWGAVEEVAAPPQVNFAPLDDEDDYVVSPSLDD